MLAPTGTAFSTPSKSPLSMWEGPPPPELRSFRSLSRASRASIRRRSRSSGCSPNQNDAPTSAAHSDNNINSPISPRDEQQQNSQQQKSSSNRAAAPKSVSLSLQTTPLSPWSEEEPDLPYPGFVDVALRWFTQTTPPRSWCLRMINNPYPFLTMQFYFLTLSSVFMRISVLTL